MSVADTRMVTGQLGRSPRGRWRVVLRCSYGAPVVIATAPALGEAPFPTLYYLTCPHLVAGVAAVESAGGCARWRVRLADDPVLVARLRDADAAYRAARAVECGGDDSAVGVGIAGERDVCGVKCLHAHVAAYLAGIDDPLGESTVTGLTRECDDGRCTEGG
ncbi:MAG: DUF501 domain-containing protein [Coriobacteriia bacterium]|nr:DUF501 domain-containing protein [Coriobacteriia bacterium]